MCLTFPFNHCEIVCRCVLFQSSFFPYIPTLSSECPPIFSILSLLAVSHSALNNEALAYSLITVVTVVDPLLLLIDFV